MRVISESNRAGFCPNRVRVGKGDYQLADGLASGVAIKHKVPVQQPAPALKHNSFGALLAPENQNR